ncbi:hypothetical protein Ocin01_17929 [Orchesella cincta]|uniref:Transmembrane protein n=1 Tax=Orchesella cincta TaxID=48709 RepID=A0A1D2M713_ORCCI|nr:hypothetical protein Ocin01_17929 [Orchesella cincta]
MPVLNCNPCPCVLPKTAVILVAIADALLKLIIPTFVWIWIVDLAKFTKKDADSAKKWAPVRIQYVLFLALSAFGIIFTMFIWCGALKELKCPFYFWKVGAGFNILLYLYIFVEYWKSTNDQIFFTGQTIFILIWKLVVETVLLIYYSVIVGDFIEELPEETLNSCWSTDRGEVRSSRSLLSGHSHRPS